MNLLFGFVVAAWLVIDLSDKQQHIPFASIEACQVAKATVQDGYSAWAAGRINCFVTGIEEPLNDNRNRN